MADELDLTEMFRRAVQANVKFYQGWLDLSLDYVRGISDIFAVSGGSGGSVGSLGESAEVGVLVLEGENGTVAQSAFLVTNDLSRKVSCGLMASEFTDSDGKVVRPKVTFEPKTFELQPGEQRVVNASLVVGRTLVTGYSYQGAFAIKGMEGISVPVVLRRRHRVDDMPKGSMEQAEADGERAVGGPAVGTTAARKASVGEKASTAKTAATKTAPRRRVSRQKG